MRARVVLAIAALAAAGLALRSGGRAGSVHGPLRSDQAIHGWTILSDSEADARAVIDASRAYGINHLQLSHQIVEDLRQIRDPQRQALVRRLIDAGHAAGLQEVVLWDHALCDFAYYPPEFRTGPGGTIDLDNPRFWEWFKADYRTLLDLAPAGDGVVLTFIDASSYARSVSGRWIDPPTVFVRHGVNQRLHYWKDVVDFLAPAWAKTRTGNPQFEEDGSILDRGWLRLGDHIDATHVDLIQREKAFGVRLAEESLRDIERARLLLQEGDFQALHHYFARTLLTARLHRAVVAAYFGFRVYARGESFRTPALMRATRDPLAEIPTIADAIREYPVKPPVGQWNWAGDADAAMRYYDAIARTGWPKATHGVVNSYGGLTFPLTGGR